MELREIFVTALAILDEKGGSQADGNYKMLWTKDWEWLRELLLEGLSWTDEIEELKGEHGDPMLTGDGDHHEV